MDAHEGQTTLDMLPVGYPGVAALRGQQLLILIEMVGKSQVKTERPFRFFFPQLGPFAQELDADKGQTALDVVLAGSPAAAALREHERASRALTLNPSPAPTDLATLARTGAAVEALGGWEARERAVEALGELGIDASLAERPVSALSGGQARPP